MGTSLGHRQIMTTWQQVEFSLQQQLICLSKSVLDKKSQAKINTGTLQGVLQSLQKWVTITMNGPNFKHKFFSVQFRPAFGHLILLMLDTFGNDKLSNELRLSAGSLLSLIFDPSHSAESADALALVLPGVFLRCQKVALNCANAAVSYKITEMSLVLILSVIQVTLSASSAPNKDGVSPKSDKNLSVMRHDEWRRMAAGRIRPQLIFLLSQLCTNGHYQIRLAVLNLAICVRPIFNDILATVNGDEKEKFSGLLINEELADLCIVLKSDSNNYVAEKVDKVLIELQQCRWWMHYLSSKLLKIVKDFSRKVRDASSGFDVFQNLVNCLEVMGPSALGRYGAAAPSGLDRLLTQLLASIVVDKRRILVAFSPVDIRSSCGEWNGFNSLAHYLQDFYDVHLPLCNGVKFSQLMTISEVFTATEVCDDIFDALIEKLKLADSDGTRISALTFASCLLVKSNLLSTSQRPSTSVSDSDNGYTETIESFLNELLEAVGAREQDVETDVRDERIEDPSTSSACSDVIFVAVGLVAVGVGVAQIQRWSRHTATALPLRFIELCVDVIYELLKQMSSTRGLIRDAAEMALNAMTLSSGVLSIAELLRANICYVVFKVALRCRDYATRNTRAPLVLAELLDRCALEGRPGKEVYAIFEQVRNVVDELLVALDRNCQTKTMLLLRAMRSYVRALERWFPDLRPLPPLPVPDDVGASEQSTISDSGDDDEMTSMLDVMAVEREDKATRCEQRPLIDSAVNVLNRTKHMVSSTHLPIQLLVMDVMDCCLRLVRHFDDDLLPMIHQNWQGLVCKLDGCWTAPGQQQSVGMDLRRMPQSDKRRMVAAKAIEVMETMCRVSRSFVYTKVTNELTPRLVHVLSDSAWWKTTPSTDSETTRHSKQTDQMAAIPLKTIYRQTATHQLQLTAIKAIKTFALECDLSVEHRNALAEPLRLYYATIDVDRFPELSALRLSVTETLNAINNN